MPGAEELLRRWAAKKLEIPVEQVVSVTFEHEDGWTDDSSGTGWPESNTAVVTLDRTIRAPYWVVPMRVGERVVRFGVIGGIERLPELLAEIVDA